uniref:FERM domain-containing protein n=1 Tax=Steinernema glaseri TaxID=37863 RepID=A0A1I7Z298_9BILA
DVVTDQNRELFGETYDKDVRQTVKLTVDNRYVVPYNPFLLLKYGSHHNLEYIGPNCCEDYVTKYVAKGCDMAYVQLHERDEGGNTIVDYDEITHTFKVRYMTAQEAMWRILKYPIIKLSHIVHAIYIHGVEGRAVVFQEGEEEQAAEGLAERKDSKQEAFLKLCAAGDDAIALAKTLLELPQTHWFYAKEGRWILRERHLEKIIVRFGTVLPSNRERYAMRLIFQHRKGPTSYEDMRTVNGTTYDTFVATAQAMGLMASDRIWHQSMAEACAEIKSKIRR